MAEHDDWYADGAAWLEESHGQAATYTAPDGTATALVGAIVGHEQAELVAELDGQSERRVRDLSVPRAELDQPETEARVTIDGVEYYVESVASQSATWTRLALVRISPVEITRPDYRR